MLLRLLPSRIRNHQHARTEDYRRRVTGLPRSRSLAAGDVSQFDAAYARRPIATALQPTAADRPDAGLLSRRVVASSHHLVSTPTLQHPRVDLVF